MSPMLDDVLGLPEPAARRPLADRNRAPGAGRLGRADGLRDGRLGDRRRPRRRRPRRPADQAAGLDPRLRAAELGDARSGRCSAPATRATPRRRSPASRRPRRWGRGGSSLSTGGAAGRAGARGGRAGGRPAGDLPAAGRRRLHVRRRRRGRGAGRRGAAHPHRDRRRRGLPRARAGRRCKAQAAEIAAELDGARRRRSTAPT